MTERVYNFAAGPAVLPQQVIKEAQRDLAAMPGTGMSLLEMSHRSKPVINVIEEAEEGIRRLVVRRQCCFRDEAQEQDVVREVLSLDRPPKLLLEIAAPPDYEQDLRVSLSKSLRTGQNAIDAVSGN